MTTPKSPYLVSASGLNGLDAKPPVMVNGKDVPYDLAPKVSLLTEAGANAIRDCAALTLEAATEDSDEAPEALEDEGLEQEPETLEPNASHRKTNQSPAESGKDDGAAAPNGGADAGGTDTPNDNDDDFDPVALLEGTLDEVTPRIAKLETTEQIDAVRLEAGDKARVGVTKALDARAEELATKE